MFVTSGLEGLKRFGHWDVEIMMAGCAPKATDACCQRQPALTRWPKEHGNPMSQVMIRATPATKTRQVNTSKNTKLATTTTTTTTTKRRRPGINNNHIAIKKILAWIQWVTSFFCQVNLWSPFSGENTQRRCAEDAAFAWFSPLF